MRVKGFGPLDNGNLFSEFYGEVKPAVARFIRANNISPSDYNCLVDGYYSLFTSEVVNKFKTALG